MERPTESNPLREAVRARYAAAAAAVTQANPSRAAAALPTESSTGCCADAELPVASSGCCGSAADPTGCCGPGSSSVINRDLYAIDEVAALPSTAVLASLGCGNPTALAELEPGETVLDLGSGGGIDVLLSARRVGPTGFAYGLDMTDEMLTLARRNAAEDGTHNVEFLKGEIEAIPLPDASVDVVISNCVINLSADKGQVLREAFRVLRPGGRFAVADVVVQGELPADVRGNAELWAGCIAGALEESTYRHLLADAGFRTVEFEVTRVYDAPSTLPVAAGRLVSAFIRATRPTA